MAYDMLVSYAETKTTASRSRRLDFAGTNAATRTCKLAMRLREPILVLLLLPVAAACASQSDDDEIEAPDEVDDEPAPRELAAEADPRCDAPTVSACTKGDAGCINLARKRSIVCEYEMLEAQKQDDPRAYQCWRACFVSFLDEACRAGDEASCTMLDELDERPK